MQVVKLDSCYIYENVLGDPDKKDSSVKNINRMET